MQGRDPPAFARFPGQACLLVAEFGLVIAFPPLDAFDDRGGDAAHSGHAVHGVGEEDGEDLARSAQLVAPFGDTLLQLVGLPEVVDEALEGGVFTSQCDAVADDVGGDHADEAAGQRILPPRLSRVEHLLVQLAPALVGHALGKRGRFKAIVRPAERDEGDACEPSGEALYRRKALQLSLHPQPFPPNKKGAPLPDCSGKGAPPLQVTRCEPAELRSLPVLISFAA